MLSTTFVYSSKLAKPFFLATSVVGLFAVFGVGPASMVSALALALIGVCRLPIAWSGRPGAS